MGMLQAWIVFLLSGMGLISLLYYGYRRFVRGKIILYIYNKNRIVYRKAVRPDSLGMLNVNGHSYYYKETEVLTTPGFLLKEPTPALVFEESKPNPVNLWQKRPHPLGEEDISSSELSQILSDGTVRDFVQAQSKINLTQVTGIVVVVGVILLVAIIGVGYWITGTAIPVIGSGIGR